MSDTTDCIHKWGVWHAVNLGSGVDRLERVVACRQRQCEKCGAIETANEPQMSDTPQIIDGELTFEQSGDKGMLGDIELLTVMRKDEGAGAFFVIKTDGWAFDSIEELTAVLHDAAQRLNIMGELK